MRFRLLLLQFKEVAW